MKRCKQPNYTGTEPWATPALRPRGRGDAFGNVGIKFRRNRQSAGREGELGAAEGNGDGRQAKAKPPYARPPHTKAAEAHMDVRAERYIRRIESADKGRTEKKMGVAKMADR